MEHWTSFLIGTLDFPIVHHFYWYLILSWVTPDVIPWLEDLYWLLMATMIKSKFTTWVLKASINLVRIYLSNLNACIYLQTFYFSQTELLLVCLPSFYFQSCSHCIKNSFLLTPYTQMVLIGHIQTQVPPIPELFLDYCRK